MKLYKVERWNNGTDGWDGNKETLAYFTNIEAASEYSKDEQANFTEIGPVFTTSKEAHIYQDKKKINAVLNKLTDKDLEILGLSRESFLE